MILIKFPIVLACYLSQCTSMYHDIVSLLISLQCHQHCVKERYLHHEATPHIIHRDIKASNILLDPEFGAKGADFGFAKLVPDGVTHLTTRVKGELGYYLAPEYAMWGKVSESCDVYSFGILLLEIISAKKQLEKLPGGVKRDIVQRVTPLGHKGTFDHIADPRLKGKFDKNQLKEAVMLALRCTDRNPENRPSTVEVVQWLKGGHLHTLARFHHSRSDPLCRFAF